MMSISLTVNENVYKHWLCVSSKNYKTNKIGEHNITISAIMFIVDVTINISTKRKCQEMW